MRSTCGRCHISSLTRTPQTLVPQPIVINLPHARLHRMRHGIFIVVCDCAVRFHPVGGCHWVRASEPSSAPYSGVAILLVELGSVEITSALGIVMSDAILADESFAADGGALCYLRSWSALGWRTRARTQVQRRAAAPSVAGGIAGSLTRTNRAPRYEGYS